MERRELICIGCPLGCSLTVSMEGAEVVSVTGNTCKRGDVYARKEVTNPTRIVTSTVKVSNGTADMVSVKTKASGIRFPVRSRLNGWRIPRWCGSVWETFIKTAASAYTLTGSR